MPTLYAFVSIFKPYNELLFFWNPEVAWAINSERIKRRLPIVSFQQKSYTLNEFICSL